MEFYRIPVGFSMALSMNPEALTAFAALTEEARQPILERAHAARSKAEMHQIVNSILSERME